MFERLQELVSSLQGNSDEASTFCKEFVRILEQCVAVSGHTLDGRLMAFSWAINLYKQVRPRLPNTDDVDTMGKVLFQACARVVLDRNFPQKINASTLEKFIEEVTSACLELSPCGHDHRFVMIQFLVRHPWDHPVLLAMVTGEQVDFEEALQYVETGEFPEVFHLRIKMLLESGCEDFALNLCNWCTQHAKFKNDAYIRGNQLVLLFERGYKSIVWEECQAIPCCIGKEIVHCLHEDEAHADASLELAQTFMVQDWLRPRKHCCTKELLHHWLAARRQSDEDNSEFLFNVGKLLEMASNSWQLMALVDAMHFLFGKEFIQFNLEMCVIALCTEKHNLNLANQNEDDDEAEGIKHRLSFICTIISCVCADWCLKLRRLSMMAALSLDPQMDIYNTVMRFMTMSPEDHDKKAEESVNGDKEVANTSTVKKEPNDTKVTYFRVPGVSEATSRTVISVLSELKLPSFDVDLLPSDLRHRCLKLLNQKGLLQNTGPSPQKTGATPQKTGASPLKELTRVSGSPSPGKRNGQLEKNHKSVEVLKDRNHYLGAKTSINSLKDYRPSIVKSASSVLVNKTSTLHQSSAHQGAVRVNAAATVQNSKKEHIGTPVLTSIKTEIHSPPKTSQEGQCKSTFSVQARPTPSPALGGGTVSKPPPPKTQTLVRDTVEAVKHLHAVQNVPQGAGRQLTAQVYSQLQSKPMPPKPQPAPTPKPAGTLVLDAKTLDNIFYSPSSALEPTYDKRGAQGRMPPVSSKQLGSRYVQVTQTGQVVNAKNNLVTYQVADRSTCHSKTIIIPNKAAPQVINQHQASPTAQPVIHQQQGHEIHLLQQSQQQQVPRQLPPHPQQPHRHRPAILKKLPSALGSAYQKPSATSINSALQNLQVVSQAQIRLAQPRVQAPVTVPQVMVVTPQGLPQQQNQMAVITPQLVTQSPLVQENLMVQHPMQVNIQTAAHNAPVLCVPSTKVTASTVHATQQSKGKRLPAKLVMSPTTQGPVGVRFYNQQEKPKVLAQTSILKPLPTLGTPQPMQQTITVSRDTDMEALLQGFMNRAGSNVHNVAQVTDPKRKFFRTRTLSLNQANLHSVLFSKADGKETVIQIPAAAQPQAPGTQTTATIGAQNFVTDNTASLQGAGDLVQLPPGQITIVPIADQPKDRNIFSALTPTGSPMAQLLSRGAEPSSDNLYFQSTSLGAEGQTIITDPQVQCNLIEDQVMHDEKGLSGPGFAFGVPQNQQIMSTASAGFDIQEIAFVPPSSSQNMLAPQCEVPNISITPNELPLPVNFHPAEPTLNMSSPPFETALSDRAPAFESTPGINIPSLHPFFGGGELPSEPAESASIPPSEPTLTEKKSSSEPTSSESGSSAEPAVPLADPPERTVSMSEQSPLPTQHLTNQLPQPYTSQNNKSSHESALPINDQPPCSTIQTSDEIPEPTEPGTQATPEATSSGPDQTLDSTVLVSDPPTDSALPVNDHTTSSQPPEPTMPVGHQPARPTSRRNEQPQEETSCTREERSCTKDQPPEIICVGDQPQEEICTSYQPPQESSCVSDQPQGEICTSEQPPEESSCTSEQPPEETSCVSDQPQEKICTSDQPLEETSCMSDQPLEETCTSDLPQGENSCTNDQPPEDSSCKSDQPPEEICPSDQPSEETSCKSDQPPEEISSPSDQSPELTAPASDLSTEPAQPMSDQPSEPTIPTEDLSPVPELPMSDKPPELNLPIHDQSSEMSIGDQSAEPTLIRSEMEDVLLDAVPEYSVPTQGEHSPSTPDLCIAADTGQQEKAPVPTEAVLPPSLVVDEVEASPSRDSWTLILTRRSSTRSDISQSPQVSRMSASDSETDDSRPPPDLTCSMNPFDRVPLSSSPKGSGAASSDESSYEDTPPLLYDTQGNIICDSSALFPPMPALTPSDSSDADGHVIVSRPGLCIIQKDPKRLASTDHSSKMGKSGTQSGAEVSTHQSDGQLSASADTTVISDSGLEQNLHNFMDSAPGLKFSQANTAKESSERRMTGKEDTVVSDAQGHGYRVTEEYSICNPHEMMPGDLLLAGDVEPTNEHSGSLHESELNNDGERGKENEEYPEETLRDNAENERHIQTESANMTQHQKTVDDVTTCTAVTESDKQNPGINDTTTDLLSGSISQNDDGDCKQSPEELIVCADNSGIHPQSLYTESQTDTTSDIDNHQEISSQGEASIATFGEAHTESLGQKGQPATGEPQFNANNSQRSDQHEPVLFDLDEDFSQTSPDADNPTATPAGFDMFDQEADEMCTADNLREPDEPDHSQPMVNASTQTDEEEEDSSDVCSPLPADTHISTAKMEADQQEAAHAQEATTLLPVGDIKEEQHNLKDSHEVLAADTLASQIVTGETEPIDASYVAEGAIADNHGETASAPIESPTKGSTMDERVSDKGQDEFLYPDSDEEVSFRIPNDSFYEESEVNTSQDVFNEEPIQEKQATVSPQSDTLKRKKERAPSHERRSSSSPSDIAEQNRTSPKLLKSSPPNSDSTKRGTGTWNGYKMVFAPDKNKRRSPTNSQTSTSDVERQSQYSVGKSNSPSVSPMAKAVSVQKVYVSPKAKVTVAISPNAKKKATSYIVKIGPDRVTVHPQEDISETVAETVNNSTTTSQKGERVLKPPEKKVIGYGVETVQKGPEKIVKIESRQKTSQEKQEKNGGEGRGGKSLSTPRRDGRSDDRKKERERASHNSLKKEDRTSREWIKRDERDRSSQDRSKKEDKERSQSSSKREDRNTSSRESKTKDRYRSSRDRSEREDSDRRSQDVAKKEDRAGRSQDRRKREDRDGKSQDRSKKDTERTSQDRSKRDTERTSQDRSKRDTERTSQDRSKRATERTSQDRSKRATERTSQDRSKRDTERTSQDRSKRDTERTSQDRSKRDQERTSQSRSRNEGKDKSSYDRKRSDERNRTKRDDKGKDAKSTQREGDKQSKVEEKSNKDNKTREGKSRDNIHDDKQTRTMITPEETKKKDETLQKVQERLECSRDQERPDPGREENACENQVHVGRKRKSSVDQQPVRKSSRRSTQMDSTASAFLQKLSRSAKHIKFPDATTKPVKSEEPNGEETKPPSEVKVSGGSSSRARMASGDSENSGRRRGRRVSCESFQSDGSVSRQHRSRTSSVSEDYSDSAFDNSSQDDNVGDCASTPKGSRRRENRTLKRIFNSPGYVPEVVERKTRFGFLRHPEREEQAEKKRAAVAAAAAAQAQEKPSNDVSGCSIKEEITDLNISENEINAPNESNNTSVTEGTKTGSSFQHAYTSWFKTRPPKESSPKIEDEVSPTCNCHNMPSKYKCWNPNCSRSAQVMNGPEKSANKSSPTNDAKTGPSTSSDMKVHGAKQFAANIIKKTPQVDNKLRTSPGVTQVIDIRQAADLWGLGSKPSSATSTSPSIGQTERQPFPKLVKPTGQVTAKVSTDTGKVATKPATSTTQVSAKVAKPSVQVATKLVRPIEKLAASVKSGDRQVGQKVVRTDGKLTQKVGRTDGQTATSSISESTSFAKHNSDIESETMKIPMPGSSSSSQVLQRKVEKHSHEREQTHSKTSSTSSRKRSIEKPESEDIFKGKKPRQDEKNKEDRPALYVRLSEVKSSSNKREEHQPSLSDVSDTEDTFQKSFVDWTKGESDPTVDRYAHIKTYGRGPRPKGGHRHGNSSESKTIPSDFQGAFQSFMNEPF